VDKPFNPNCFQESGYFSHPEDAAHHPTQRPGADII
jgi:hypothetical protein